MNISRGGKKLIVIGAGAAGCFAAARSAQFINGQDILVLERGRQPLSKVKISGGGRCNVTHACFSPSDLVRNYPRGSKELRGPFHKFQPRDTVDWFSQRGVQIKTESDGRMFPVTDDSQTIIDCLLRELAQNRVSLHLNTGVRSIEKSAEGFNLQLISGDVLSCERCLLALGSLNANAMARSLEEMGHSITPLVPSLFTFKIPGPTLKDLAGLSVPNATVSIPSLKTKYSGPLLVTHWGLSGPAVLKLSAFAARELHQMNYQFEIEVDWLGLKPIELETTLKRIRELHPKRKLSNFGPEGLPKRLWQRFLELEGLQDRIWGQLRSPEEQSLLQLIGSHKFSVSGKSTHKDEFVTCGGVDLAEVDFRTMESKLVPGLYFAGETLDIDGITGGFNFQAAWATGFIAGSAIGAQGGTRTPTPRGI